MLEISDMIVLFLDRYLRREPEVGVDLDLRGPVRSARQRLHIRLEHVLAQGDPHLQPHSQSHPRNLELGPRIMDIVLAAEMSE